MYEVTQGCIGFRKALWGPMQETLVASSFLNMSGRQKAVTSASLASYPPGPRKR